MVNKLKEFIKKINVLTPAQEETFLYYLPGKVYKTERNIGIFVASTQVVMIMIFLLSGRSMFYNFRSLFYMTLYISLLTITVFTLFIYRNLVNKQKHQAFLWLRRGYAVAILLWVIGITFLEQMKGNGISVYSYLVPTLAAFVFMTPVESACILGGGWLGIAVMLLRVQAKGGNIFGDMVNSIFVTLLAIFISYRYYRSMTTEYCDRQIIEENNQLLQKMVHTDQLTGLYNRHFLREQLYAQFQKGREQNWTGLFLMADIDYFKQYNDHYGHIQGDFCLKEISSILQKICAEEGIKAIRYGGEEFLLIGMGENLIDGMQFASKLLYAIQMGNLPRTDTQVKRVTVSAGLWCGTLEEAGHIETAIKWADEALYQAKNSGRNRIVQSNV